MPSFLIRSPGDLRVQVGIVDSTPVEPVVALSTLAFRRWSRLAYEERGSYLTKIGNEVRGESENLALSITLETGKTIREAREELSAVGEVFAQVMQDAADFHFDKPLKLGPADANAELRHTPRGPVAVIAPFNFPVLYPVRIILPYLLSGNTVVFKTSPTAAIVGAKLAEIFQKHLPEGVLTLVQGGAEERVELCKDERIRSISFSGNLVAAREIVDAVALDFSKTLAIETGGKNAVLVLEDGDPVAAAKAAALGVCSMAGQRGDSTSRAIVHERKLEAFCTALVEELKQFMPGPPNEEATNLSVLINEAAHKRYAEILDGRTGEWILRGDAMYQFNGRPGYYVKPAARLWRSYDSGILCPITNNEIYAPVIDVFSVASDIEMIALNNATSYGGTASIFTKSRERFESIGAELRVGNLFANIPTIGLRAWLPSCGRRNSNNGKPFGRGFIRYTANELSVVTQGLA